MADKPVTKRGRPSKAALQSTKDLSKRQQAAALKDFRARLLLNPKSPALIEKMFDIAFDDEHKQQAQVSINISGIGTPAGGSVTVSGDAGEEEGIYEPYEPQEESEDE